MFAKCDPKSRTTCKSDSEVKEWLNNKYLLLYYNKKVFNPTKMEADKLYTETSYIDWIPAMMDATVQPYFINAVQVILQDGIFPFQMSENKYYDVSGIKTFRYGGSLVPFHCALMLQVHPDQKVI